MGCEVEVPTESITVACSKCLKILAFCRFLRGFTKWLGGRDSNPDNVLQRHASYRWTTSQSWYSEPNRNRNYTC